MHLCTALPEAIRPLSLFSLSLRDGYGMAADGGQACALHDRACAAAVLLAHVFAVSRVIAPTPQA
jgi:hypothetical protein